MAEVVVLGGSLAGLSTAAMLTRRGHHVTVVERDAAPPDDPGAAGLEWQRPSTPQLRHSHVLLSRGVHVLEAELPDVVDDLLAHGAHRVRAADHLPPGVSDRAPRPGDEDLRALAVRRPVLDWALARAAARDGIRVLRAVARGLLLDGTTVRGVATDEGSFLADVVVDASGRRSRVPRWLGEAGLPVVEQRSPCGVMYLSRVFTLDGAPAPTPLLNGFGTFALAEGLMGVLFRGEGDTFTISLPVDADDHELLLARDPAAFDAVARLLTPYAAWIDAGRALTDVLVMAGLDNTSRRLVRDGAPVITGLLQVGDAAATTNPTLGRGMSMALVGGQLLCEVLGSVGDPAGRLLALDALRTLYVDPFVQEAWGVDERTRAVNRHRLFGEPLPARPETPLPEEAVPLTFVDRDAWERVARKNHLLAPPSSLYDGSGLAERVLAARGVPPPAPAVTRAQVLAAARGALV